MKRIISAIFTFLILAVSLSGCMSKVVEVTVELKNPTDYELKWVIFDIPQSSGTYSPMYNIITAEGGSLKPNEKAEVVISFVSSDFGNSGSALIGLEDEGDSDSLEAAKGEVILSRKSNYYVITYDGEDFLITAADNKNG